MNAPTDVDVAVPVAAALVAVAPAIAVPQDARTPVAKPKGLAARAKAAGSCAVAAKGKGKSETPVVKAPAELVKTIDDFVAASSRKTAAEGEMNVLGGQIRDTADILRITESRNDKAVHKTVCLDGKISFTWPGIKVGDINNGSEKKANAYPAQHYKDGLFEVFGAELYAKYFTEADSLVLKDSIAGNQDMIDKLFRLLEGDPTKLLPTDKGENNVGTFFDTTECVAVKRIKQSGGDFCPIQHEATLDPRIEVMVKIAVARGFLKQSDGALKATAAATNLAVQQALSANAANTANAPIAQVTLFTGGTK